MSKKLFVIFFTCIVTAKNIDCDPTYSIGNFYKKGLRQPKYKFDLTPQIDGVVQSDCRNLPLENESLETIMFDPPFVVNASDKKTGIIRERFTGFKNIPELWSFYNESIIEFHRILKDDGILIFKCQDTVNAGKNWFSHVQIMNLAITNLLLTAILMLMSLIC